MLKQFCNILFEPEDCVEVRVLPKTRESGERSLQFWMLAEDVPEMHAKLTKLNHQGKNIFAGVLPRACSGGGTDADAMPGQVIWCDIERITAERATKRLAKLGLPEPSMTMASGGGFHAYWKLDAKAYPEDISIAVYSLAEHLDGDRKVDNPSRVMRLPGYVNTKYDPPKKCEIISYRPDLVYSYPELTSKYPQLRRLSHADAFQVPEGTQVHPSRKDVLKTALLYLEAVPSVSEGEGRNNKAHELAKRLRDKGLEKDEAFIALRDGWNNRCSPALSEGELYSCVHNGYRYAQKAAGCEAFGAGTESEKRPSRRKAKKREQAEEEPGRAEATPKNYTEIAMSRIREQAEGKLNVISLPWVSLAESCPIIYPRKAGIITGNPGVCKTWFAMHLCKAVQDSGAIAKYLPLEDDLAYYLQRGAAISSGKWEPASRVSKLRKDMRVPFLNRLERKYGHYFEWWGNIVEENPTMCDDGEIRAIESDWVLDWAEEQCDKGARLLVIDSLAQIEFDAREEWKAQATFWRQLLGIANRSNATILMIIHLSKTAKGDFRSIYSVEASKRFGDLAFSILGLQQCLPESLEVLHGDGVTTSMATCNTIIHNMKCREGTLAMGSKVGFFFGDGGPNFNDCGILK